MSSTRVRYVPDLASILGVCVGLGAIAFGLILEGGKIGDIYQVTGALIVFGGTAGAVMLTTPLSTLLGAIGKLRRVFFEPRYSHAALLQDILHYANSARKNGIVSLEGEVDHISDPFLRKALRLAVDGTDLDALRGMMELELEVQAEQGRAHAKVFEAAGGYSPTIGIIGAVLGLIQVMKHLENIDEVGRGIAVAFVATVYGVAAANLFFLPAAGKLRCRAEQEIRNREFMLEGVCSIVQGMHPKVIEQKLEAYMKSPARDEGRKAGAAPVAERTA